MEPEEFRVLATLARKRKASVSDLMRESARAHLLTVVDRGRRSAAADAFLSLPETRLPSWKALKKELDARRG